MENGVCGSMPALFIMMKAERTKSLQCCVIEVRGMLG